MKQKIILKQSQMRMLLDKVGIPPCCKSLNMNGATAYFIYKEKEKKPPHYGVAFS